VEILPDAGEEDGRAVTRSLNLVNPACQVRVYRGRMDLGGALLAEGERFSFEGMQLGFPEIRYWGEFSVVTDPGAPVVFAGFAIGLAGLILKLPGRRREAEWLASGRDGVPRLRGWGGGPPVSPGEKSHGGVPPRGPGAG
jgi:cytochrome c biogenesis protein ResB